jgi:hypothetical protein
VVASGNPGMNAPAQMTIALESGDTLVTTLSDEQRQVLARGGVVQLYRGFVEPREQVLDLSLAGGPWAAPQHGFVSLDPPRDRITLVRFELGGVDPASGVGGIRASVWLHDSRLPSGNG